MALHDQPALANLTVAEDLFVATEMSAMELLVTSDEGQAQFYIGHSGWGPGQLENELQEGSWLVLPATASQVFNEIDTIGDWKKSMIEVGRTSGPYRGPDPTRARESPPQLNPSAFRDSRVALTNELSVKTTSAYRMSHPPIE